MIGHEVREVQAARLLTSITEQLKQEELLRQSAENDFVEMECVLKRRVLYLEQYKAAVGGKMGRLQGRLDLSVPQEDYLVRTFTTSHSSSSSSWRKTAVTLNRDEMNCTGRTKLPITFFTVIRLISQYCGYNELVVLCCYGRTSI